LGWTATLEFPRFGLSRLAGVLTTLLSLIRFAAALAIGVLYGISALTLPRLLDLAERISSALLLVILRLGVRIVLIGICHIHFL
jgi:hypothetical protein